MTNIKMRLNAHNYRHYVDFFNEVDQEPIRNTVSNDECWNWMCENIPWFECPDRNIEQIYYFRWWVFRKHIKSTPDGYVITEFLPDVGHGGKYNTISFASGLHILEGRWLHNRQYLHDYALFWFRKGGELQHNTFLAFAIEELCRATGDFSMAVDLLPDLLEAYRTKEELHRHESGLLWCKDTPDDGGEYSISGNGLRPTLNAYMYGNALSISRIAEAAGEEDVAEEFVAKAERLKHLVQEHLWDPEARYFKTYPLETQGSSVRDWDFRTIDMQHNVREIYGFIPWLFGLPDPGYEDAWRQILDPEGIAAPFGPTTAEQRHPRFMKYRVKRCQWDGASWPFTTSLALGALARLLREYNQKEIGRQDYMNLIKTYARSQHRILPYGEEIPWIGECLHPHTGIWLARAIALEGMCPVVKDMNHAVVRGKDYNHSSYCDLIISGLIGFQAGDNGTIKVAPLVPDGIWDWFCLDGIKHGNKHLTILYDKTGEKYRCGSGLRVFADGREIGNCESLSVLSGTVDGLAEQTAALDRDSVALHPRQ